MQTSLKIYLLLQLVYLGLVAGASDCEDLPCSHSCVVVLGEAKCLCPDDMYLGDDKKTCQAPVSIFLAMFRDIKRVMGKSKEYHLQPALPVATKAFDIHFANKELYASANNSILRYSLKPKNDPPHWPPQTVILLRDQPTSLAVDWVRNDIYWISSQRSTIEAATHQGTNHRTVLTFEDANTQALPGDPNPQVADWHHLHVDPYVEKLFWVGGGLVYSVDLKGQNLQVSVGDWRQVSAVTLDTSSQYVYVMGEKTQGGKNQYIGRCRYDGSQPQEVEVPHPGVTVYSFGVLGRTVYWQTFNNMENLYKTEVPISGNIEHAEITLVEIVYESVYDMKIYHPDVQKTVK